MLTPTSARSLALALSCCACNAEVLDLDGAIGRNVYRTLAGAWCEHLERCADAANAGRPWASPEACVASMARGMSPSAVEMACDGSNDVSIPARALRRCVRAFADASCQRLPVFLGQGIAQLRDEALLAGCREAIDEIYAAERRLYRVAAAGAACDERTRCNCEGASETTCGVCRDLPQEGEPCLHEEPGSSACGGPFICSELDLCEREAGVEGAACVQWRCQAGLECDGGLCLQLHREGDACTLTGGCGKWFVCDEGTCRFRPGLALGEACTFGAPSPELQCWWSTCVDGVCVEEPGLGERCVQECPDCDPVCQPPYSCSEGVCVDTPVCSAAEDEPCRGNDDCVDGYYCTDSDFRCRPRAASLGERCVPAGGCEDAVCIEGTCIRQNLGDACERDEECDSARCEAGRCAAPRC